MHEYPSRLREGQRDLASKARLVAVGWALSSRGYGRGRFVGILPSRLREGPGVGHYYEHCPNPRPPLTPPASGRGTRLRFLHPSRLREGPEVGSGPLRLSGAAGRVLEGCRTQREFGFGLIE